MPTWSWRSSGEFVDPVFGDAYSDDKQLKLSQFDEAEWNDRLTSLGLRSLTDNPRYAADVVQRNLLAYLEVRPSYNERAEYLDGRNLDFRAATLPIFYVVTALGLCGLALNRYLRALWPAVFISGQFALLSMFLVAPPRLRAPFDLMMCIGVGLLAERCAAMFTMRRTPSEHVLRP